MDFKEFQRKRRVELMPSGDKLAKLAQKRLPVTKSKVRRNFNLYLRQLIDLEFTIYKKYERKCSAQIIKEAEKQGLLRKSTSLSSLFKSNYNKLWEFFLSISQSRMARAGGSFERHVRYLFELLNYPFDRQSVLNGKVDYVIPSVSAFKKNRTACVVISIKRTLRERWREVVGELASINAGKIYMLTADPGISFSKVKEIRAHNINLVIWDEYKKEKFKKHYSVLGFTQFVNVDLPSSKKMWKQLV